MKIIITENNIEKYKRKRVDNPFEECEKKNKVLPDGKYQGNMHGWKLLTYDEVLEDKRCGLNAIIKIILT